MHLRKRTVAIYAVGVLMLTVMWSVFLFPSDELIKGIHCRFQQVAPDAKLSIDQLGLTWPVGLALERIAMSFKNTSTIHADRVRMSPELISWFQDRSRYPLMVQLVLEEIGMETAFPMIDRVQFKRIVATIGWMPEKLDITTFTAQGEQINGNLSGMILFQSPVEKSRIQLSGSVHLKPEMIARLKVGPFGFGTSNPKMENSGISFQINGTLESPLFSFN